MDGQEKKCSGERIKKTQEQEHGEMYSVILQ